MKHHKKEDLVGTTFGIVTGDANYEERPEQPVTLANARDLHVITERADGPDLDDLVRLIRYLRGHRVQHSLRDAHTWEDDDLFDPARLTVAFGKAAITDGAPLPDLYGLVAYFVGPDGTVYDCNGEAL